MSKILSASLLAPVLVVLSLSLTACGKDEKEKSKVENPAAEQVTQSAEPVEESTPISSAPAETPAAEIPADTTAQAEIPATEPEVTPVSQQVSRSKDQMLALAKKSGCLACHSLDKKLVGPAWKDVATRYKGKTDARAQLIEKVSRGGKGNWKDVTGGVPMPPYFPRVTEHNIERLVDFVLSL